MQTETDGVEFTGPTTPGILSRSPSTTRLRSHRAQYQDEPPFPKSKSSSQLLPPHPRQALRALKPRTQLQRPQQSSKSSTDWLLRAGAVLASEARESKGQSWLASRASSTSLVGYDDDDDHDDGQYNVSGAGLSRAEDTAFADDEYSPVSRRTSRGLSSSRRTSQRTSRVQSRVDLRTPLGARTPSRVGQVEGRENVFEDEFARGPDFVDEEEGGGGR